MNNPYETPSSKPPGKESRRELWRRRLICPYCYQPGVSAGIAYLAHPFFKVRCSNCQGRSRVRLTGAARKRLWALWIAAVTVGFAAIAFLVLTDPMSLDEFMDEWLPGLWNAVFTEFGFEWQIRIVLLAMLLIPIVPLLILLVIATRICLRDVVYCSELIPADERRRSVS